MNKIFFIPFDFVAFKLHSSMEIHSSLERWFLKRIAKRQFNKKDNFVSRALF